MEGPVGAAPVILYVEDDDDTRELVHRWLREAAAGAVAVAVGSAVAALEFCRATMPLLVITDLRMPYMDGEAFIRSLHDEFGDTAPPVLILTGAKPQGWRPDVPLVEGVIHKPADKFEVLREVERCLRLTAIPVSESSRTRDR